MNPTIDFTPIPERRASFRVMDAVALDFVKLQPSATADAANDARRLPLAESDTAAPDVRVLNKYDLDGYAAVKREYPAVAHYIEELEEQIRTLMIGGATSNVRPTHRVSLSVSGIAFADKRLLQPGDRIQMSLTLFPENRAVSCAGTVVNVGVETEIAQGELHTYRVAFDSLDSRNRAVLESHVDNLRRTVRQPAGMRV